MNQASCNVMDSAWPPHPPSQKKKRQIKKPPSKKETKKQKIQTKLHESSQNLADNDKTAEITHEDRLFFLDDALVVFFQKKLMETTNHKTRKRKKEPNAFRQNRFSILFTELLLELIQWLQTQKHTWPRTQKSPCSGDKKSFFLLTFLSTASNIPFPSVGFQRQIMNTAMSWGRRPWLLSWKVVSEKIKYLPWLTQWSWLQNQILLHINTSDPSTWGAKIPHRIPDYILAKAARSYTLQPHLLILRIRTRSNSVVAKTKL